MRLLRLGGWAVDPRGPPTVVGYAHLALVVLLWGSGPIAIGVSVSDAGGFGPLWLGASRLLVAGAVLLAVALARGYPIWPPGGPWRAMVMGLVGWSIGNGAQVVAQTEVSASLTALIVGLAPAFALSIDATWARRWPAAHHALAVGLGLSGLAFLVSGGADGGDVSSWALMLLVLAALGWAAAAVMEGRNPVRGGPSLSAGWQMLWGGLGLAVAAVTLGEPWPVPTALGWVAWAWLALACAALGFLSWIEVLRRLPVAMAMTQPTLSTVVAVWLGMFLLDETLHGGAVIGMVLTIVGAGLAAVPRDLGALRIPRLGWRRS